MCGGVRRKKWLASLLTVNQTWGGRAFRRRKPYIKMCLFTALPPPTPPTPPTLCHFLLHHLLWLFSQSPESQTNEYFLFFISASHLFINAHKAVAGTYHWQLPLGCLSDETEVAEFTKCSYGRMDVTGSEGRSYISLHRIHRRTQTCAPARDCVCIQRKCILTWNDEPVAPACSSKHSGLCNTH